ncbi:MAG: T9SS type B sorting domain-containing protein [Putridiphycobacter sp.]
MKIVLKNIVLLVVVLAVSSWSFGQGVTAGINPTSLPCGGGQVSLTASGNSTNPVFCDNFNTGGMQPGWSTNVTPNFTNPCVTPVDGTTYLWMGNNAAAPRAINTPAVDVSCGGQICFDYITIPQGGGGNCEGQDLYNEGVGIQYSTNGGGTWTTFGYFAPNGDVLGNVPNTANPGAWGATPFTTWGNYCFNIPAGAFGPNTIFRIRQFNSSGTCCDHWGIDNFCVFATPCAPFYYDWDHIPGAPDPADVTANVTQTTTFTVHYTDGVTDYTDNVTVNVASISLTNVSVNPEACLGDNDASITTTADVSGGTAPFTYTLSGPTTGSNTTGSFSNLSPGLYTMTLTDAGGCTDTYNFTVNPGPACCSVTASGVDPSCFGGNDGTATANPANGTAPYTYAWSDGQSTQTATGLTAGTYTVTITDANGCTSTASTTLSQPTQITASSTPSNVSCNGGNDGSITVTGATGGTPGYTYSVNGGTFQTGATLSGLTAGSYVVTVKDANGCTITLNQTISEPTAIVVNETNNVPATCGLANGQTTVSANGGTGPYTYTLGVNTNTTGAFNGLLANNYTVTVTDANNCTETINVIIGNSAGPVPSVDNTTDVVCAGGFNGSVSIAVNGGTGPYTYELDNSGTFQNSNTFTLTAGTHTVTVQDANTCTGDVTFTINEPSPLTYSTVIDPALCNGSADGQITINASGSTAPYSYSADGGTTFQGSNVITGLAAGAYNIVVQDINGCLSNSTENVPEPAPITADFTFVEPSCFGVCDAEIHLQNMAGGNGGYTYSVDNGNTFQASPDFLNQCAGSFDIIVQDANNCILDLSGSVVTTPPQISFTFIANNPSNCGAQDGSFIIAASNGTAPYDYFVHNSDNSYVSPVQTSGNFQNLFSGLYTLIVSDANGCTDSTFSPLSDQEMTSTLQFQQDVTCYNGSDGVGIVSITSGGVPPITFVINTFATGFQAGPQANGTFGALPAGEHTVTMTDQGQCVNIIQFTLNQPDTIQFSAAATDVTCPTNATNIVNDGTITISNPIGGANTTYEYSIDGGTTYQTSPNFTGLAAGTYVLFVRDVNGCEGQSTIDINQPDDFNVVVNTSDLSCNGDNTGFMQVVTSGATANYNFDIGVASNTTGIFGSLAANPAYNILITDNVGCTFSATEAINEPPLLTATYALTDATCNGTCNGEILVTANGGTPNYLYSPDNGITYQSSNDLTGLCAGNHPVRVKDDNNCVVDATQTITEPTLITFTMTSTPATCGNDNATVTVTANNGTPPYQYSASTDNGVTFSALQAATTITDLPATSVIVKVTDANGCEVTQTINLSADPLPQIDFTQTTDPLCNGDNNGIVEITASNGVAPYQYSVGGAFQPSNIFNTLLAGTYTVTLEDVNGCQASTTIDLVDPDVLVLNSAGTDLLCNNDFTGEIVMTATGGTAPYLYSIDGGTTTQGGGTFSAIAAGNYNNLILTDFNNCQATGTILINEPAPLTWTQFDIVDPNCFGEDNGSVTTATSGGTTPYTYNWSSAIAGNGDDATGATVFAGTYSVILTDANGCQLDSMNFVLTDPAPVSITSIVTTDVSCHVNSVGTNPNLNQDGTLTVTVPVQTPAINQFSIDGGATFQGSNVFTDLLPGNYDVTAQNANGCQVTFSTTVSEPTELMGGVPPSSDVCYGYDVLINPLLTTGGTEPYSFTWTDDQANVTNAETYNQVITQPMTFDLLITDNNGCTAGVYSYTLSPTPQLEVTASSDVYICPGETVTVSATATGGQLIDFNTTFDYAYSWVPATANDTLNTLEVTPLLDSNAYIINVVDDCGATASDTVVVFLHEDPTPVVIGGGVGCMPYEASFVNGGNVVQNGGSIVWSLGDGTTITNQDSISYVYTEEGCYDVGITITTVNGCSSDSTYTDLVCVNPNPIAEFDFIPALPTTSNQVVEFNNLSEGAYAYFWTFDEFGTSSEENPVYEFNADVETTYEVCLKATSDMGCVDSVCHPVTIYEELIFYVPNVFTPDHDDYNETFQPQFTSGYDIYDYHLIIFNRWGETVFESYNAAVGWDGTYGGTLCEDGVYVWQINFGESISDKKHKLRGHVTLLK